MKTYCAFLLCCLFAVASPSTSLGENTFRPFITADGRSLNAAIKDYNERNGKIQIKREDGKLIWTRPTVFSELDQEYIRQWIAVDQFMSSTKFRIKGDSDKDRISKTKTRIEYEITLENKTDFPLKDLRIEYRTFILKQGYEGSRDSNRVGGGQLHIAEIPAGKKISQKVSPVNLSAGFRTITDFTSYTGSFSTSQQKIFQDCLKGFWVKVYGPEVDGKPVIREWCNPSDTSEKFSWQDIMKNSQQWSGSTEISQRRSRSREQERKLIKKASLQMNSNPEKALEIAQEAYKCGQSPGAAALIGRIYLWSTKPPNIPLGLEWSEKAAQGNDYVACCTLARFYSTYIDPQFHNAKKGIKYGLQAVSINSRDYQGHDKLAEAYALDGQFNKAVEHAKIAYDLYKINGPENGIAIMKEGIERYRNHKTCPLY